MVAVALTEILGRLVDVSICHFSTPNVHGQNPVQLVGSLDDDLASIGHALEPVPHLLFRHLLVVLLNDHVLELVTALIGACHHAHYLCIGHVGSAVLVFIHALLLFVRLAVSAALVCLKVMAGTRYAS